MIGASILPVLEYPIQEGPEIWRRYALHSTDSQIRSTSGLTIRRMPWVSEETGDDIILKKNKNGRVIGLEKLNVLVDKDTPVSVEVTSL